MSDVLPPPPPPRGDSGCWKWGVIGCGAGCGVLALVFIGFMIFFFRSPMGKKVLQGVESTQKAQQRITTAYQAIERFKKEKGRYPNSLSDLVPNYVSDLGSLRLDAGSTQSDLIYYEPAADAPPEAPMLEYRIDMGMPGTPGTNQVMLIRMRKDGNLEMDQSFATPRAGSPSIGR